MKIKPIKSYKIPCYPTREFFISHPESLNKHIPLLWKSKKLVMNALIAFTLGNYIKPVFAEDSLKTSREQVSDKDTTAKPDSIKKEKQTKTASVAPVFVHGEGRGTTGCVALSPPVFLSEQEARQVINEEFKKENIIFDRNDIQIEKIRIDKKQKKYEIGKNGKMVLTEETTGQFKLILDAFNAKYNIGYEFVSYEDYFELGGLRSASTVQVYNVLEVAEQLSEKLRRYHKINAGVFYDPMPKIHFKRQNDTYEKLSADAKQESIDSLKAQVNDFIDWIKKEGIIEQNKKPE